MATVPRHEYPRPLFQRDSWWTNLNGTWTYAFDMGLSGADRGYAESKGFDNEITVPFCPESKLSGVEYKDFIPAIWYHRKLEIPDTWAGRRIILHFGAVDYESEVFVDGRSVGRHWGGSSSFSHDITAYVRAGDEHELVVYARDDTRSGLQPIGKQSTRFDSYGCHYTRTTGIWQTVWVEAVPEGGLRSVQIIPDVVGSRFVVIPQFYGIKPGYKWRMLLRSGSQIVAEAIAPPVNGVPRMAPVRDPELWGPKRPHLYEFWFQMLDEEGEIFDRVSSHAGLRSVQVKGNQVHLNGEPIYLRLVLDQGYYPDGIWTAPSDESFAEDINLALLAGFNGARLHQKVFEPRFHFWADKLGYLTWGESASWGLDLKNPLSARNFLSEWREIVERDRNHASIIAWTPFNETRDVGDGVQHHRLHRDAYDLTKTLDPTRPINDASGYVHVKTDLWTVHTYNQDPDGLKAQLAPDAEGKPMRRFPDLEPEYEGQPYIVDEFGGIKWVPSEKERFSEDSWGYGDEPKTQEEFFGRLEGLVDAVLSHDHISGFCYTQLTDVEQEQNGIYYYDRSPKFDPKRVKSIFSKAK